MPLYKVEGHSHSHRFSKYPVAVIATHRAALMIEASTGLDPLEKVGIADIAVIVITVETDIVIHTRVGIGLNPLETGEIIGTAETVLVIYTRADMGSDSVEAAGLPFQARAEAGNDFGLLEIDEIAHMEAAGANIDLVRETV